MCHSFDIFALNVLFFDPSNMLLNCLGKESQFPSLVVLPGSMRGHVTFPLSAHDQHWCVRRGTIPLCCSLFFGKLWHGFMICQDDSCFLYEVLRNKNLELEWWAENRINAEYRIGILKTRFELWSGVHHYWPVKHAQFHTRFNFSNHHLSNERSWIYPDIGLVFLQTKFFIFVDFFDNIHSNIFVDSFALDSNIIPTSSYLQADNWYSKY